jgi:hypothetical protein
MEDGVNVPGRARASGVKVVAEVVRRAGRSLKVRFRDSNRGQDTSSWIIIDDMPHRFSPGDKVTIERLESGGERWVLIDVPALRDVADPEPIIVRIESVMSSDPLRYQVCSVSDDDVTGEMLLRKTPFEVSQPGIGDRILALEVFAEKSDMTGSILSREFLGLSSKLPTQSSNADEPPIHQGAPSDASITTQYCEMHNL